MEFSQKLQQLRAAKGMTQEELAAQLFVSRTAVSKWESGRGCPNIESLKAIATFFSVTVDELLSGGELLTFAEQDLHEKEKHCTRILCGALDCLSLLLLLLPFFGQTLSGEIQTVQLLQLVSIRPWLKISYCVLSALTGLNGFTMLILSNFKKSASEQYCLCAGLVLSILSTLLFVLTRQPYPGAFTLCCLICKGYFLLRSK